MASIPAKDGCIDVVYSPDDGGWYLHRYWFSTKTDAVSKKLWPSDREALEAIRRGRVRWEKST